MTPPLQRSTVPNTSPIGGERTPLTPNVEPLKVGAAGAAQEDRPPAGQAGQAEANGHGQTPAVPESRTAEVPKWQTLERKEARLRGDQVELLTALRKQVAAQRRDRSEIITDNTLIRIAVDLLAAHRHRLRGDTEEELLRSILPRRARQAADAAETQDPGSTGQPDGGTSGVRE
jgi:hypothetical protein